MKQKKWSHVSRLDLQALEVIICLTVNVTTTFVRRQRNSVRWHSMDSLHQKYRRAQISVSTNKRQCARKYFGERGSRKKVKKNILRLKINARDIDAWCNERKNRAKILPKALRISKFSLSQKKSSTNERRSTARTENIFRTAEFSVKRDAVGLKAIREYLRKNDILTVNLDRSGQSVITINKSPCEQFAHWASSCVILKDQLEPFMG